jgi:hypothetical protein
MTFREKKNEPMFQKRDNNQFERNEAIEDDWDEEDERVVGGKEEERAKDYDY